MRVLTLLFFYFSERNYMASNVTWSGLIDTTLTPDANNVPLRARVRDSAGEAVLATVFINVRNATAPVNTVLPTITGNTSQGGILTTSDGTWAGTQPITFTYQWYRCTA